MLQEERDMLDANCSAQEHVLDEMKLTKDRIAEMRRNKDCLDEILAETIADRQKLELKADLIKQRQTKDSATEEADMKSDLEKKKCELD